MAASTHGRDDVVAPSSAVLD